MELSKIESLLEKYEDAQTSLAEEKQLQEYFTSEKVPQHLWEYKMIFGYTQKEKNITYTSNIKVGTTKRKYAFVGIAASIILAVGIFTTVYNGQQEELSQQNLGTIENPEEAYLKTKEALQLVSEVFNEGKEELVYIETFNNTTDKYIK